ncbi:MAG: hypothetical protein U5J95_02170 [Balneolaceae bacterium]|nr:hypothetical protein [Balneolaceae bacterium]
MSKSKSLGSSPIGYTSSGNEKYKFIPDLGVSTKGKDTEKDSSSHSNFSENHRKKVTNDNIHKLFRSASPKPSNDKKTEKKIASYYLEEDLINCLKQLADNYSIYYSQFVSDAIKHWIEEHNYEDH